MTGYLLNLQNPTEPRVLQEAFPYFLRGSLFFLFCGDAEIRPNIFHGIYYTTLRNVCTPMLLLL